MATDLRVLPMNKRFDVGFHCRNQHRIAFTPQEILARLEAAALSKEDIRSVVEVAEDWPRGGRER